MKSALYLKIIWILLLRNQKRYCCLLFLFASMLYLNDLKAQSLSSDTKEWARLIHEIPVIRAAEERKLAKCRKEFEHKKILVRDRTKFLVACIEDRPADDVTIATEHSAAAEIRAAERHQIEVCRREVEQRRIMPRDRTEMMVACIERRELNPPRLSEELQRESDRREAERQRQAACAKEVQAQNIPRRDRVPAISACLAR